MSIDLNTFCNPKDARVFLRKPFLCDGHLCATDGVVAVRVKSDSAGPDIGSDHIASVLRRVFSAAPQDGYVPFAPRIDKDEPCRYCGGHGRLMHCDECDGEGQFRHGSHWYECDECSGSGEVPAEKDDPEKTYICDCCRGTKTESHGFRFAGGGLGSGPARMVAGLPGVVFAWGAERDGNGLPVYGFFRFDGGDGVIMARRVDAEAV